MFRGEHTDGVIVHLKKMGLIDVLLFEFRDVLQPFSRSTSIAHQFVYAALDAVHVSVVVAVVVFVVVYGCCGCGCDDVSGVVSVDLA